MENKLDMLEFDSEVYLGSEWSLWETAWDEWIERGADSDEAPEPPNPIKTKILVDPTHIVAVYEKFSALQSIRSVKKEVFPKLDELVIVTPSADFTVQCTMSKYKEKIAEWKKKVA